MHLTKPLENTTVTEQGIENMNTHIFIKDSEPVITIICNKHITVIKKKRNQPSFYIHLPRKALSKLFLSLMTGKIGYFPTGSKPFIFFLL